MQQINLIKQQCLQCTKCNLCSIRKNLVFDSGPSNAKIMLIGEAPGADEDAQGVPFVGRSGKLLNEVLLEVGLKREDIYVANIIKARPPNNRRPTLEEVNACLPYLQEQLKIVNPKIIGLLGATALQSLLNMDLPITKVRGNIYRYMSSWFCIPIFHPSYILRNNTQRPIFRQDLQKLREYANGN